MKPTKGRIVHYYPQDDMYYLNGEDFVPAMVVDVIDENTVSLQVFCNNAFGVVFRAAITDDNTRSASYWAWPQREES